jgi:hypothetical protein
MPSERRKQAEANLRSAQKELAYLNSLPEDDYPVGTVLKLEWKMPSNSEERPYTVEITYAEKEVDGLWYDFYMRDAREFEDLFKYNLFKVNIMSLGAVIYSITEDEADTGDSNQLF